jgi:hypothetical protein
VNRVWLLKGDSVIIVANAVGLALVATLIRSGMPVKACREARTTISRGGRQTSRPQRGNSTCARPSAS